MSAEKCGIPAGISSGNVWYEDGTISGRYPPYTKGTFFDVVEINRLFRSLSEYFGHDIDDILAGGKYHDTKQYMKAMIGRMRESLRGELPSIGDLFGMMAYPMRVWGIADAEVVIPEPGKMELRVKNPYSIPLLCGDVAGATDAMEGGESRARWEGSEEEGVITVVPSDAYSRVNSRLKEKGLAEEAPTGEELECERCGDCGAPRAVAEIFRWEEDRPLIFERATGRRYCFNNTNGIAAVLNLLVFELGEEVRETMLGMVREHSRELYSGLEGVVDPGKELETYPFRGWGRARASRAGGGELSVEVENPYSALLLTGRIWGMQEAALGRDLRLADLSEREGRLRLTLT